MEGMEDKSPPIPPNPQQYSLIVVSNRLPFVLSKDTNGIWQRKSSAGGLVTAVAPVVVETGGSWVGWTGVPTGEFEGNIPESSAEDKSPTASLKSEKVVPVNLTNEDHELYYNGFCNATLWPIFHSMPGRATFNADAWQVYKEVNTRFALVIIEAVKKQLSADPGKIPVVWIHDYHLLLAASEVRAIAAQEKLKCILAFFLHIPFPSFDLFKILPWEDDLLEGLLGCDLIGFHDSDYCINFLDCCKRCLGYSVNRDTMIVERNDGRFVHVKEMPISIPYAKFEEMAKAAPTKLSKDLKVILGVDRLDYTKGISNRLLAFGHLLETHREYIGKVMLLQVAVPSRIDVDEYQDLKVEMDRLVGAINGKFSTANWSPIRYIYGCLPQSDLAGLYRDADIALVTPLRDGMNLVAKEFVACRIQENGILILSPFAGAGKHMQEALSVNPYEMKNVSDTLHRALEMPEREQHLRMKGLRAREETHDVSMWMKSFLDSVDQFVETKDQLESQHNREFETKFQELLKKKRFALLLDFDGTLSPLVSHPDLSELPHGTRDLLQKLQSKENVTIAVISGRQVDDVKGKVGIEGITYSGCHGNVIKYGDGAVWENKMENNNIAKLEEQLKSAVVDAYEGSWIENKIYTLCVHIRQVKESEQDMAKIAIEKEATALGINCFPGHGSVECKPAESVNKGTACEKILRHLFGEEWQNSVGVIYIGDDATDEDAMKALKGKGLSLKVMEDASNDTSADIVLKSTRSVVHFFHWFLGKLSNQIDLNINVPVVEGN